MASGDFKKVYEKFAGILGGFIWVLKAFQIRERFRGFKWGSSVSIGEVQEVSEGF